MAKLSLKNILSKENDNASIISSLASRLHADFSIEDSNGKILLSNNNSSFDFQFPVVFENEPFGLIRGNQNAGIIAEILSNFLSKESERKKLGTEVLNLYQEINLIFNFSDKLAQTIGAKAIAEITLDEARHVIKSDSGVVVLWDEATKRLEAEAFTDRLFFNHNVINRKISMLVDVILSGQSEIVSDVDSLRNEGIVPPEIKSVIYSALKVKHRIMGAVILGCNEPDAYPANSLKLLTTLALQSSSAIESSLLYEKSIREAEEREAAMRKIFDATEKFVPYQFLKSLGHEVITDVKLGDQAEKVVTVLFTDIRDYTSISEQMTPEETFGFICLFNARMGPIVRKHHGFVNQYLGDSIMAIFPVNAAHALEAAIEIQQEMQIFNEVQQQKNKPSIQIGVGLHTGPLIMGITGDEDRMDACTISDTVNTASRVESLTKHYKASILLSEESLKQIEQPERFHLRNLGLVQLKGKLSSIKVHECFSSDTNDELQKKISTLDAFNEGVSYYLNQSFGDANEAFKKVLAEDENDATAKFFYQHTQQLLEPGMKEKKSGVVEMEEK